MSKFSIVLWVLVLGGIVCGVTWFLLRPNPSELDISAKSLPELAPIKVAAGDWPWWRGPTGDNHSPDAEAPLSWSETENIVWKKEIPGRGHSTPILVGNRVIVTSADEKAERQFVLCFDRGTGEKLWETTVHEKNFASKHNDNSHASSTPATDGQRVFVAFANNKAIHITALDLDGKILWSKEAGPHGAGGSHGYASSVAIWGPYVFVNDDSPGRGWLAAFNRENGEIGWRKGKKTGIGSYGSPIVTEFDGKPQLITVGNGFVTSYDPKDGGVIWEQSGLAEVSGNSVTVGGKMIFASSGFAQRRLIGVKADGSVAWKKENSNEFPYPPSMLWNDGHLYVVSDQGLISCFQAETGSQKWKERLKGSIYSSPLLVGKHLYVCNRDGLTTILEISPDACTEVAKNKLASGINASPIVIAGKLWIRTETHLYSIGKK
ncbi:MAG: PQQ-binding-like beta-propeller repeat protein [Planctomycetes bacterium]|nr:PQQ-binding-like beta-propeller repeat protein [Planctomycetota bacterium]